jgi:hypothetical protein
MFIPSCPIHLLNALTVLLREWFAQAGYVDDAASHIKALEGFLLEHLVE